VFLQVYIPSDSFIIRHILSNVGRVASRDSSRTYATIQDLFTALCEDDAVYGLFKKLKGIELGPLGLRMHSNSFLKCMTKLKRCQNHRSLDVASHSHVVTALARPPPIRISWQPGSHRLQCQMLTCVSHLKLLSLKLPTCLPDPLSTRRV
jgi:hypothetical protein